MKTLLLYVSAVILVIGIGILVASSIISGNWDHPPLEGLGVIVTSIGFVLYLLIVISPPDWGPR